MASFKEAFAAARKAGKKEFSWNGKSYNTKLKEEVSSAPSKSKIPAVKPAKGKVSSGRGDVQATGAPKVKVSSGRGAVNSAGPRASSKPVANPRNAPGFIDKLRMGSAARTQANLTEAEMKKRKALAASRAGKG